jgi:hypothetical protein
MSQASQAKLHEAHSSNFWHMSDSVGFESLTSCCAPGSSELLGPQGKRRRIISGFQVFEHFKPANSLLPRVRLVFKHRRVWVR